ncbi:MAG: type 1 glutamine amidotransferase [Phycisphaerae bacterium]|nr:type 1 glutamine amidotransferase [Phycisphaerae bacterium]
MAIIVFQHWDKGGSGRIGMTLREHGFRLDIRHPASGGALPADLDNVHGLVILGGPQNVTDIARYPWMQREVELIKSAHARELPVIGVCLGAQLIAHALGGKVEAREGKPAMGMFAMSLTPAGQTDTFMAGIAWNSPQSLACGQQVTQLPAGATLLGSTANTKNAMFRVGMRTFASVPHFECDRAMLEEMYQASAGELSAAGISLPEVQAQIEREYPAFARLSDRLCVNLATYAFPVLKKMSA